MNFFHYTNAYNEVLWWYWRWSKKKKFLSTIFSSHHFWGKQQKMFLPPLYPGDISLISVKLRKSLTKKKSKFTSIAFSHQHHFHELEFVLSTFMSVRGNRKKSFPVTFLSLFSHSNENDNSKKRQNAILSQEIQFRQQKNLNYVFAFETKYQILVNI